MKNITEIHKYYNIKTKCPRCKKITKHYSRKKKMDMIIECPFCMHEFDISYDVKDRCVYTYLGRNTDFYHVWETGCEVEIVSTSSQVNKRCKICGKKIKEVENG